MVLYLHILLLDSNLAIIGSVFGWIESVCSSFDEILFGLEICFIFSVKGISESVLFSQINFRIKDSLINQLLVQFSVLFVSCFSKVKYSCCFVQFKVGVYVLSIHPIMPHWNQKGKSSV